MREIRNMSRGCPGPEGASLRPRRLRRAILSAQRRLPSSSRVRRAVATAVGLKTKAHDLMARAGVNPFAGKPAAPAAPAKAAQVGPLATLAATLGGGLRRLWRRGDR